VNVQQRTCGSWVLVPMILAVLAASAAPLRAGNLTVMSQEPERLEVAVGKSILLKSHGPVSRISIANTAVADIVSLSPTEIYVTGKAPGITNMTLWQGGALAGIYNLEVGFDTSVLKQKLHEMLPDEGQVRVTASPDALMLSGKVSSAATMEQALSLAKAYAPEGKVKNMLEVGGVQQVMLEVKVSEMQKSVINRLGINWAYIGESGSAMDMIGGLMSLESFTPGQMPVMNLSDHVNTVFSFRTGNATQIGVVEALREDGLLKLLAEPTLIGLSGQEASILVGGEYPIPVPQGLGTVAVEYKEFGVILKFTPTVLAGDRISLAVNPEVSELDFTNAARIEGYVVPGLTMRRASTVVQLSDGQSYAVAGLLRDNVRDKISKYPFLGEIPVLGNLFRSRSFQNDETELVIIVTPRLVKPLEDSDPILPTDFYVEPDYVDFFLLGSTTGRGPTRADDRAAAAGAARSGAPAPSVPAAGAAPAVAGKTDGDFGHAIPMTD